MRAAWYDDIAARAHDVRAGLACVRASHALYVYGAGDLAPVPDAGGADDRDGDLVDTAATRRLA